MHYIKYMAIYIYACVIVYYAHVPTYIHMYKI